MTERLAPALRRLLEGGEPCALVTVAEVRGSTPRGTGARMLVTRERLFGTVGGGRLEWDAALRARALLAGGGGGGGDAVMLELPLGPEIGQCCGGWVRLRLEPADRAALARLEAAERAEAEALPAVALFGAGHVGRALAAALAPLPFRVCWIDPRAAEFPADPPPGVEACVVEWPVREVAAAPAGAAYVVTTHSHGLDFELCEAVLRRGDFAWLGLIGSLTKRRRFERGLRELGIEEVTLARLVCPMGLPGIAGKEPAIIAASVAAQLLMEVGGG